jgi:hypothetical protein
MLHFCRFGRFLQFLQDSTGLLIISQNRKVVPGKTAEISFVDHGIGLLKPQRLASGIFGHLVFSFF